MSTFERRNYSDQLNIETPEQVELEFQIAGLGSRCIAVLLDHSIQVVFIGLEWLVIGLLGLGSKLGSALGSDKAATWFFAGVVFLDFLMVWGYFALFEAFWRGQTPGKRAMKIRVIKDSGRQITFFEALARNLVRYVDLLPNFYLAGAVTMLCNKRSKRLGDFAAGTIVIHEGRDEQPLFYQSAAFLPPTQTATNYEARQPNVPALFPDDAIARLQPGDLHLIDTFFTRALDLNLETRASMALRIANGLAAKMGVILPEGNPERILEAIALQMRGSGRRL